MMNGAISAVATILPPTVIGSRVRVCNTTTDAQDGSNAFAEFYCEGSNLDFSVDPRTGVKSVKQSLSLTRGEAIEVKELDGVR